MAKYLLFFAQKDKEDQTVESDSLEEILDRIQAETRDVMWNTDPESMPIITFSIGDITAVARD